MDDRRPPGPPPPKPTPGELLLSLPAWPREWAQRLGREASEWGARSEVHPSRSGRGWELRWVADRRVLATLRPVSQGVEVEVLVPATAVERILERSEVDEEFRRELRASPKVRQRCRVTVPLSSARRSATLSLVLGLLARLPPG